MRFDYNECIKKGLLRKIPPSKGKAERSIEKAKGWLQESEKNIEAGAHNSAVLSSYLAMFHSARAILFKDGYREKSHACVARYLEGLYVKKKLLDKKWVELLDHYRELRHSDQYNLSFFTTETEAKKALESAKGFVEIMEDLI